MLPLLTNLIPAATEPSSSGDEVITPVLQSPVLRLEHLVSHGQASPPGFWYDQPEDEWVVLLRGTATLDFGNEGTLGLKAGDSLTISAHQKHRVDRVSDDAVWLALHFKTSL